MSAYPYTIENGAGEWLTFAGRVLEPEGERVVGEALVTPGAGPPMHVHHFQEEAFTAVHGRLGYQIAGHEPAYAQEGATVVFPAGAAHRFWNAGEEELRCTAYIKPAGNAEYFLSALFASQKADGGGPPSSASRFSAGGIARSMPWWRCPCSSSGSYSRCLWRSALRWGDTGSTLGPRSR